MPHLPSEFVIDKEGSRKDMPEIDPDRLLCRKTDMVGAQVADGYVMLDLDNRKYIQLNGTAEIVWELLEVPKSLGMIADLLQERFDVEAERCRTEVQALLGQFLKMRIVAYQG